jgi:alkylation response protein AidB-like acyl-CoA dehydrogenase
VTTTAPTTSPPSVDEFRERARAWLAEHADELIAAQRGERMLFRETRIAVYDAGFGGIAWPVEYGGLGLSAAHQEAFSEEAARYPNLMVGDLVTVGICAPTLLDFGSEEQKRRYIPHMLRGDEVWTQLLSEPGAGSDLAGLQTRAVRDGDEWIVNGQKVWTSVAQWSELAICIARTNADVPKHQGLSMFIVDMHAPGVTIRPLKQITGNEEFNEVFLDDVRLPADFLVGAENDGWRALLRMLMHERMAIGAGTSGARMGRDMFSTLRDLARERGVEHVNGVRDALLDVYVKERLLAWLGQRMRDGAASGKEPGPEGSLAKLLNAIVSKASSNAGMLIGGANAQAWDASTSGGNTLAAAFLQAPMTAIAGGTSEIQRNTIGERVLGLPKEPQVDRDIPFRDVLQNPQKRG